VSGTQAQIIDGRATTPGLRLLERYAVELGGGLNSRFGLDDGVVITSNHVAVIGGVTAAVTQAKEKLGYLHRIGVQVSSESELKDAVAAGADVVILDGFVAEEVAQLSKVAKELSSSVFVECSGAITPENVRQFADAGADLIRIDALTNAAPAMKITFNVQSY